MTAHTLGLASMAYLGDLRGLRERQTQLLDEARDRGNRLAAVCLACGPANIGWLAADDPVEAQRRADQAALALRQLAEGEMVRPGLPASPWMIAVYILAALFALQFLALLLALLASIVAD